MNKHQEALDQIKKIVEENNLTWTEVSQTLQIKEEKKSKGGMIEASEILAYIGGILIFAGLGVYTTMFWQELSSALRVGITFGSGFSCYCIALGLSQDLKYDKATQALFLIAAILQPAGLYVFLNEVYVNSSDVHLATLFVFGIMFLQQLATFWQKPLNLLLFTVLFFAMGFTYTLLDYMGINVNYIGMGMGTSLFLITYSLNSMNYKPAIGFWYFMATVSFLWGAYDWLYNTRFEVLFLGLCALTIYLSTMTKSKAILFTSTIGLLAYIGRYTMLHFVSSIGWPVSLILIGASFILLSGFALKIKRKYM